MIVAARRVIEIGRAVCEHDIARLHRSHRRVIGRIVIAREQRDRNFLYFESVGCHHRVTEYEGAERRLEYIARSRIECRVNAV